jgi:hypothetical protein
VVQNDGRACVCGRDRPDVVPVSGRPAAVTEVNSWQPSGGREFRVLAPGEPFFSKTHYPHNKVVGGGFQRLRAAAGLGGGPA